jgi:hypothetical protein
VMVSSMRAGVNADASAWSRGVTRSRSRR